MKDLRILCFGASLVEGFTQYGLMYKPYALPMAQKLKEALPDIRFTVDVDGKSGQMVTLHFEERMEKRFRDSTPSMPSSTPPYNYTLFLGGTNDLGWGADAAEIWDSIKAITATPLAHNCKVVLFTVPECAAKSRDLDARRDELNRLIKADDREGVYVFDLHTAMPYHSLSEEKQKDIWDDGLHFTPAGYEVMGELVARRLLEIIESEKTDAS